MQQQIESLNNEIQQRDNLLGEMEKEVEEFKAAEQLAIQELEAEQASRAELENELAEKDKEMAEQLQEAEAV